METVVHTIPIVSPLGNPLSLIFGFTIFLMIRWVVNTLNPVG